MMIKKKMHDHAESRQNHFNKTSDNKENTDYIENKDSVKPEDELSGDNDEYASDGFTAADSVADKVATELIAVEEKLAEMQDKYVRLSAEFDNYRKRTLREKMDITKYAGENLLLKIIPLMDDFDRALSHMDSSADCAAMKSGIDLIYNKFGDFLKQNGIKEIETLNTSFNVDLHEAVAKVPVEDNDKKGKVVDVLQKGYYLQDKVLRFSKVVVGE